MKRARAGLTAMLLLAAPQASAYVLLEGPMPPLGVVKPVPVSKPTGFTPAPRFNLDAHAPIQRGIKGSVLEPNLVNRNLHRGPVGSAFADGGGYSDELERRGRTATTIGNVLAPAITLRTPLD